LTVPLAITPDTRWDASPTALVAAAGAAGFSAVGIGADRVDAAAVEAYRQAGVRCHEVLALVLNDDEATTIASAERLAIAATTMGADWVLTVFRTGLTAATAKLVQRCAQLFAEAGAGLAAEFSPLGPVSTIPLAMEMVRAGNRGGGRAGLMIDSWHFSFGGSTWDELARVPLDEIAYLQFTDALAPAAETLGSEAMNETINKTMKETMNETMNRRALPGEGVLELHRFSSTLRDRGWQGLVSVEVLSEQLRALPVSEIVQRIARTTAPYWR
jgi:sugar phosphate isomerase/epimerase